MSDIQIEEQERNTATGETPGKSEDGDDSYGAALWTDALESGTEGLLGKVLIDTLSIRQ